MADRELIMKELSLNYWQFYLLCCFLGHDYFNSEYFFGKNWCKKEPSEILELSRVELSTIDGVNKILERYVTQQHKNVKGMELWSAALVDSKLAYPLKIEPCTINLHPVLLLCRLTILEIADRYPLNF